MRHILGFSVCLCPVIGVLHFDLDSHESPNFRIRDQFVKFLTASSLRSALRSIEIYSWPNFLSCSKSPLSIIQTTNPQAPQWQILGKISVTAGPLAGDDDDDKFEIAFFPTQE